MARPKRIRKMTNPPHFKGFRSIGQPEENNPVVLNYEEYEAIRLSDFELYSHLEASQIMEVSRPTYSRIYESARRKIGEAFVLGKAILFEGGKVFFDTEWYSCTSCGCYFNHPAKEQEIKNCSLCGSTEIEKYHENTQSSLVEDICVCPKCGHEKVHSPGVPCRTQICQSCNCQMVRKGTPHQHRNRNCN
ncbi:MAG: DUF134 domain-containing protein [Prolixibacteraceae bacterium]